MRLPRHLCLTIHHNDYKVCYLTAEQYLKDCGDTGMTDEEQAQCIAEDCIWEANWCPDTPVGTCFLYAPTLEGLLVKLEKSADEEEMRSVR